MGTTTIGPGREVSSWVVATVTSYVNRAVGAEALRQMLDSAGFEGDDVASLRNAARWFTFEETARLYDAAAVACGDDDIGRRCGEELFRQVLEMGLADFFVATGSVGAACEAVAEYGSRLSDDRPLWVQEVGDDYVVIQSRVDDPAGVHPFFCGVTAGYYSNVPSFFGHAGVVTEFECQRRGAPQCSHRLSWRPIPSVTGTAAPGAVTASSDLFAGLADRLEHLQKAAAELVGAEDVDGVLDRIAHHVSGALNAPRYLVAARLDDRDKLRVHQRGFRPDAVDAATSRVLSGDASDDDDEIVVAVEVASRRRSYGRLAAFFGAGSTVQPSDRRLLEAYAAYAAAALEVISSLQDARRERDTARALLELASALAEVGTVDEIAVRLSEAAPAVVDADFSHMWLFDPEASHMVLKGWHSRDPEGPRPSLDDIGVDSMPELTGMIEKPRPMLVEMAEAPRVLRAELEALGLEQLAVVPIRSKGTFLGVVTAGFRQRLSVDHSSDTFTRLAGLADHAATALENAGLLERARHEALHDRLTGLPNRPLVEDRGRQAFAASSRSGRSVGLLFVDLDRFKIVNDTLGHRAGDELIKQVAHRMQSQVRPSDTLARLGGDEFVVLLPELADRVDAAHAAERLIDALNRPFHVEGHELFISCSVGVAISPDHGTDYESLLQYGDAAMYAAKAAGRGAFAVHAAPGDGLGSNKLELASQLHRAIENAELRLHYQPQVDMKTMRIVGVEALVRWQHPDLGLLPPGEFLPLAEESGMIVAIDTWTRRQAFAQANRWHDCGQEVRVAVNLSARTLSTPGLADVIAQEIAELGVPARLLELEITERAAMSDRELRVVLERLKALDVRLAIDDFGTGTSVLARLQSCPIDTLKIDRSLVEVVTADCVEAPLLQALIALAHTLEMEVVAEGVETTAQGSALRRYGCDMMQGFIFSPAVPADHIDVLFEVNAALSA